MTHEEMLAEMTTYEIRFNTTIHDRLILNGWTLTGKYPRCNFYHKRNWTCRVPNSICLPIRFWRNEAQA